MSVHPIPGASYHALDSVPLFVFSDIDLEAEGSSDPHTLSQQNKQRFPLLNHTPSSTTLCRRGPPVMLILLLLCCLAFVVSAFMGTSANLFLLPDVPESQAWLANQLSVISQSQSYKSFVEENHKGALEILYACHGFYHSFLTQILG
jgi:hypothetical protein